jgi:hypothetical protein
LNNKENSNLNSKSNLLITQQSLSSSGTDGSKTDLNTGNNNNNNNNNSSNRLQFTLSNNNSQNNSTLMHSNLFDIQQMSNFTPYSYQITSMNESKAKQLCKKRPYDVIW